MITEENFGAVISNLTTTVVATNETVDQNRDSIRVVRTALSQTATILQSISEPAEVEQVSCACAEYAI